MSKNQKLLIVESPTKARTITRMVGDEFKIMASMGHVRDLPEHDLGVDVEHDFAPLYVESARGKRIIADLCAAAKNADEIYLAPDPDREGEAIAWHLQEVLKKSFAGEFKRVSFHEITQSAILRALENSGEVDMNLVDAQQARRVLDRLVGYRISPLLWSQVAKGSSAGRVQSVALRLIVEREREITAFVPEEYWVLKLQLRSESGIEFEVKLAKINAKTVKVAHADDAARILAAVMGGKNCRIAEITRARRFRNPAPPFTTSTLQQTANQLLHYSATSTMRYAQELYEGVELGAGGATGLITYMRTDSVNIAKEAQEACRAYILNSFGTAWLPGKPNFYKSKAGAQEAHEAIRPTDVTRTPDSLSGVLESAQLKLYTLIWKRFVASQMKPAEQELLTISVTVDGADAQRYDFRTSATATIFPGFMRVMAAEKTDTDEPAAADVLAKLKEQEACAILSALKDQKFTEPPPRFTEATLIKLLEENGIGRPSTYATILQTIQTRKYVERQQGKLVPTELGFKVTDFLVLMLPKLFEVDFTSKMEEELDGIESGKLQWTGMMKEFYEKFITWLNAAKAYGAVADNKIAPLIAAMKDIRWNPPEKHGKFTRDDKKFFTSIATKLEKSAALSARQSQAVLDLALQYESQLPELAAQIAAGGLDAELAAARERASQRAEAKVAAEKRGADQAGLHKVFDAFANVKFAPAVKRGARTYDDQAFYQSLKEQFEQGKPLSDRQLAALGKIARRYWNDLSDPEAVGSALQLSAPEPTTPGDRTELAEIFAMLGKVTVWNPATKKGRRTYDDQSFYTSLKEQFDGGRAFSDKQLAALKKLAAKYAGERE